jgi:3-oxoacyl-(acyl-carrier-protein) synthase
MKPVAISAAACRFPGAPNLAAYWERIAAARPAPLAGLEERWELPRERYFSEDAADEDKTYLDQAFCLEGVDPGPEQDRQELVGAAVIGRLIAERGPGLDLQRTGLVLATNFPGESYFQADAARYLAPFMAAPPPALAPPSDPDRLLRVLADAGGLAGPRLSIDTACSSSLYALDLAIGLLETNRAEAVVVCGLTGYLPLFLFVGFSRLRALSPTGQIRPFARDASGILLGEGCGAVLLERESAAPLAWIRGLGLSSDGNDRSVFAPGADGQRLAYERAYADLDPGQTDYVEAHGTATAVGDATELQTLNDFFGPHRSDPLPVGSVKSLVGHQLAAAGMAALLKGLLMLQEGILPPHLPVEPHPDLAESCCELRRSATPWKRTKGPRRLGVSSFGFGGSNAHLVLEEAGPVPPATPRELEGPLVISDLEVVLGCARDTASWAEALEREEPPQSAYSPERFGLFKDEVSAPGLGTYFPPRISIEGAGLRMGPRLLARLDPFQLLLTDLSQRLLARHPSLRSSPEVGVSVLTQVGGAAALQANRRHVYLSHEPSPRPGVREFLSAETSTESIASSLGTMCSGYPAFHLDLRAFHATLSGPAGSLSETFALGESLVGRRCAALLLGVGNLIKGPLELSPDRPLGEAAGFFLLERERAAEARGAEPLARILAQASTLDGALERAGLERAGLTRLERIEVDPLQPPAPGAQSLSGHLGVASGLEALSRALLLGRAGQRVALEWSSGDALVLEILRTPAPVPLSLERPLEVSFLPAPRPAAPGAPRSATFSEAGELGALPPVVFQAYLQETGSAICSLLRLQREALGRLAHLGAPPSASFSAHALLAPPQPETSGDLTAALQELYPSARHRVLRDLTWTESGAAATLVIDQEHPYYFDHALDHAPGILLVEALSQLSQASLQARGAGPVFVRDLQLTFRSFCELEPAAVTLEERPLGPGRWAFVGRVTQGERAVLSSTLQLATLPQLATGATFVSPDDWPGDAEQRLVRKARPENVLSSRLTWEGGQTAASFAAREPEPEHALAEGGPSHGPTYLLEVARQAISMAFAVLEPEAFDRPRVLISLRIALDAPPLRGAPLAGRIVREPYVQVGGLHVGEVRVSFRSGQLPLGSLELKVQNADPETYRRQREGRRS